MRYTQPQYGVIQPNRLNPVTRGLVNLYSAGRDAATGSAALASDGAALIATPSGLAVPLSGSNYVSLGSALGSTGPMSYVAQFCSTGLGGGQNNIISLGDRCTLRIDSGTGRIEAYTYNGGGWDQVNSSTFVPQGTVATVVFTHSAANGNNLYVAFAGSFSADNASASARSTGSHDLRIGLDDETARSLVGWVSMAGAFTRELSPGEAGVLVRNPWQLLSGPVKRAYGAAAAVTNVFSSAAAATVTAAGASTAAGVVSSAGVATPTGAGASIVAAAGSVSAVGAVNGVGAARVAAVVSELATATVTGAGAATSAGVVSELGAATVTGAGASTASGVVSELASASVLGVSGAGGTSPADGLIAATSAVQAAGASIASAAGSISASASLNGAGAIIVSAAGQITAAATVNGSSTRSAVRPNYGQSRHRGRKDEEGELLDLAAMLIPLISQGGPLWAH